MTLIGLEAARRLGRPTVVLCPNTAIQAQWMAQWQAAFGPDAVPATASRELPTPLTVLTYQALCTLGAPGDEEEAGGRLGPRTRLADEGVLSLLHPNGRALIARLQAGGPWTLVLDECHHLLELWGRLLQAVRLPSGIRAAPKCARRIPATAARRRNLPPAIHPHRCLPAAQSSPAVSDWGRDGEKRRTGRQRFGRANPPGRDVSRLRAQAAARARAYPLP